jgi:hypothetical protein
VHEGDLAGRPPKLIMPTFSHVEKTSASVGCAHAAPDAVSTLEMEACRPMASLHAKQA